MSRSVWRGFGQQLRGSAQKPATIQRAYFPTQRRYSTSDRGQWPLLQRDFPPRPRECMSYYWGRAQSSQNHPSQAFARSCRQFSVSAPMKHGHLEPPKPGEELKVTFIDKDGESHTFEVAKGDNLLDIAQANDLEMEGACGGSCACSTCHVIVTDDDMYDKMPEPDDDENDMLDLAFGLTETSRLGCQVKMAPELDGLVVKLPSMTRNMQASDFGEKNKGHGS